MHFIDLIAFSKLNNEINLTPYNFVSTGLKVMRVVIILLMSFFSFSAIASISPAEKQALIDLYHATGGKDWDASWDITTPVENWNGVIIIDDKVVALKLINNNLKGELPSSIGNLKHLKVLNLHNNSISGKIPTSVGNLDKLIQLNLSMNTFQGNVPEELSEIENLEYLYIYSNDLTGSIPDKISQLPKLRRIRMYATNIKVETTTDIHTVL